ncbi:hypothetical protein C8035_v011670 [Colletotrichum spinosum]|uniref:Rhodopsin domain-containing protein n=1 Tax=Colletotrichum spinosum TaxID=1347390 RepID=A0A4V3HRS8_9PEZI|nr:hypothetical protein C8035_v011670 [Colletotrichum spinosum]
MLALLAVDICSQMAIDRGFGQDIWMLSAGNITDILQKIFFVEEILYAITITTTKTSIVMFYLRIFQEPSFRTVCFATQCTNVTFGAWHIMQILFTTTPISYNWTFWDEQHSGTRGNVRLFSFINGGINIALDLWLFILPVTQLVTVSSCIRLETLAEFGLSRNPTRV